MFDRSLRPLRADRGSSASATRSRRRTAGLSLSLVPRIRSSIPPPRPSSACSTRRPPATRRRPIGKRLSTESLDVLLVKSRDRLAPRRCQSTSWRPSTASRTRLRSGSARNACIFRRPRFRPWPARRWRYSLISAPTWTTAPIRTANCRRRRARGFGSSAASSSYASIVK